MFEGAFLKRQYPLFSNACAAIRWKLNLTNATNESAVTISGQSPVYLDVSCNAKDFTMSSVFLPVSLLGLLLSLFSAHIFLQQCQRTSFRTSLVALSVATSGYMLCTSLDFANVLSGGCLYWREPNRHWQVLFGALVCLAADSLLCLRNWCTVLMTAQRTEALIFPLKVKKLLRKRNFVAALLVLQVLFVPLSLVRSFAEFFVVCSDANLVLANVGLPLSPEEMEANPQLAGTERNYRHLILEPWFHRYEAHVFFTVQTVTPVTLVIGFSIAMSIAMLRSRGALDNSTNNRAAATGTSRSQQNKIRASRTVLCLAAIFTVLQMPSYLGQLLSNSEAFSHLFTGKIFHFVAELALFLDSIFNMFVYAYFVPDFRVFFVQHWRRATCRPLPAAPLGSSQGSRRARDSVPEARQLRTMDE